MGRTVGYLRPDKVFVTHRRNAEWFGRFKGFAMSVGVIERLRGLGVRRVVLVYDRKDGGQDLWEVCPDAFYEFGLPWRDLVGDWQRVLNLKYWRRLS